ncbi:MAG: hypothetical protein ACYDEN_14205, partial [Acidimicrobiales bacterium]
MTTPPNRSAEQSKRRRIRPVHLALIGGLTAGSGFAAVTGISAASSAPKAGTTSPKATEPPLPRHSPGGFRGPTGNGGEGTITALSGRVGAYTLTLRTMEATETVTTNSSTTVYGPDLQTTTLSSRDVGSVVRVDGHVSSTGTSSSEAVTATTVRLVDPTVVGRVVSTGTNTYTIVGPDGQEITVDTTAGTTH